MKAVILAGGRGTRLAEETESRPKPLVEIGSRPIIWHIMHIYAHHGIREFVVCLGYKGYLLKEYFLNLALHDSDVTIDVGGGTIEYHRSDQPDWRVTLVDTGLDTMTGGRIKRIAEFLTSGEPFCLTYGDGVGDIDVSASVDFHHSHGQLATMTTVRPPARFGTVALTGDRVTAFAEKSEQGTHNTNGGFFVLEERVLDYIKDDTTTWEQEPLRALAADGQLAAYRHDGFWQPMDTVWERNYLEKLWASGRAPWNVWE